MNYMTMSDNIDLVLIAAVAENNVIGSDGDIPWHYPEDLEHFKQTTLNEPLIMGRKTFESLPSTLPNRQHIVLSTSVDEYDDENVQVARNAKDAIDMSAYKYADEQIFVAGGETVYETFLPIADKMILTHIPKSPDGDTYFPEINDTGWEVTGTDNREEFTIKTYESTIWD